MEWPKRSAGLGNARTLRSALNDKFRPFFSKYCAAVVGAIVPLSFILFSQTSSASEILPHRQVNLPQIQNRTISSRQLVGAVAKKELSLSVIKSQASTVANADVLEYNTREACVYIFVTLGLLLPESDSFITPLDKRFKVMATEPPADSSILDFYQYSSGGVYAELEHFQGDLFLYTRIVIQASVFSKNLRMRPYLLSVLGVPVLPTVSDVIVQCDVQNAKLIFENDDLLAVEIWSNYHD